MHHKFKLMNILSIADYNKCNKYAWVSKSQESTGPSFPFLPPQLIILHILALIQYNLNILNLWTCTLYL